MSRRTCPSIVLRLLLAVLAAGAPQMLRAQEPLPPPEDPVIDPPASEEPLPPAPRRDFGEPKVERGKAGPELVVPRPSRQPSGATLRRRRPDLPDPAPRKEAPRKPAPEVRGKSEVGGLVRAERDSIAEASSQRLVESLATRKRVDDEEGRRIRAELAARGAEARVALRAGLSAQRPENALAIAELLFPLAEGEDWAQLHRRAMEGLTPRSAKRFAEAFAAAEPDRRDWILAWFEAGNPNLRAEAERRVIELDVPTQEIRARIAHAHPDVRRRVLRVLEQRGDPSLAEAALRLLDDDYVPNAQAALALLVARGGESEWEVLRARFRTFGHDRAWARAGAALLEREASRVAVELELADLPGGEAAFSHPDLAVATAAAAVVAAIGLRCDDERATLWLRERVPHLLVRAIGGDFGHAEMPLLRPAVLRSLRRLSGLDLGEDGRAWKTWWGRVGGSFTPRREFFALDPNALAELELRYFVEDEDGEREQVFAQVSEAILSANACAPDRRWLAPDEMRELHDALDRSGIAKAAWPAGRLGEKGRTSRGIELRRGTATKRIDVSPEVADARWEALCSALDALEQRTLWQPFLDLDRHSRWADLHAAEAAWWRGARTEEERRARLRPLIAAAIDDLDSGLAWAAYDELERALPRGELLEADAVGALLEFVGIEEPLEEFRRALLELVAKRGAGDALERVKTIFALRPARYEERLVLGGILAAAGPDAVRAALADPRPPVLAGAAEAAYVIGVDPPLPRLVELAQHPTAQVRLASIRSLGRMGAAAATGPLLERFERAPVEERLEAAEALARLASPAALAALSRALASDDVLLRRAIFAGFEQSDAAAAALALATYAVGRASTSVDGVRARAAFLRKPLDQIRAVCRSLGEDPGTRRAAALLWAEALDAGALPALLAELELTPDDAGVIQGLTWLCCRSFDEARALTEARRFAEEHAAENPQTWFARACEESGWRLPEGASSLRSSPSRATLDALCRVLESGAPELRLHAARYLAEALREDFGYVTTATALPDCERIARAYRQLLRDRS